MAKVQLTELVKRERLKKELEERSKKRGDIPEKPEKALDRLTEEQKKLGVMSESDKKEYLNKLGLPFYPSHSGETSIWGKLSKKDVFDTLCSVEKKERVDVIKSVVNGELIPPPGWEKEEFVEEIGSMPIAKVLRECKKIEKKKTREAEKEAKKRNRKPSEYNKHISGCMKKDNTMKECAVEWKEIKKKNLGNEERDKGGGDLAGCGSISMLSSPGCSNCQDMKEAFKEEISRGDIEVRSVDYGEGKRLAGELGVDAVPSFVCEMNGGAKEVKGLDIAKKFGKEGI